MRQAPLSVWVCHQRPERRSIDFSVDRTSRTGACFQSETTFPAVVHLVIRLSLTAPRHLFHQRTARTTRTLQRGLTRIQFVFHLASTPVDDHYDQKSADAPESLLSSRIPKRFALLGHLYKTPTDCHLEKFAALHTAPEEG